ncbi:TdeIII family type II restriction endonuclease [uncultured Brachyspira sp.]|uniref:TdeIII family type II restriction endonuclease n=1 Tax=uncultured Brachyspira sp. TaxID=221953 RepID=UPI0026158F9D|nr:TdeIII family type II restriction endonuclease [uncultured Brachyspira sp.]
MPLTKKQKDSIKEKLYTVLRNKFRDYKPETTSMPFHTRLLGKDRMALYSFIQSLNTNFGTSIFEPLAVELGKDRFKIIDKQVAAKDIITSEAQIVIQNIMDDLRSANKSPNKDEEIKLIKKVCKIGEAKKIKPTKIDIYIEDYNNNIYLIDLKTAKPNKGEFKDFKRTLLEWAAVSLYYNSDNNVHTMIGIPYNPYEPKPYERWTIAGMLDLEKELKVAEDLWNFIGGDNVYNDILLCFEEVGLDMRKEIDEYFYNFLHKDNK